MLNSMPYLRRHTWHRADKFRQCARCHAIHISGLAYIPIGYLLHRHAPTWLDQHAGGAPGGGCAQAAASRGNSPSR